MATPRHTFDDAAKSAIKAGDFNILDVVQAGSPRACDALGMHEDVACRRCGAKIAIVYATTLGPLGGDCLATLTGDASTRRRLTNLTRTLTSAALVDGIRFRLQAASARPYLAHHGYTPSATVIEALYPSGYERHIAVHEGLRAEVVMILERIGFARGYAAAVFDDAEGVPGVTIVNPRHTYLPAG